MSYVQCNGDIRWLALQVKIIKSTNNICLILEPPMTFKIQHLIIYFMTIINIICTHTYSTRRNHTYNTKPWNILVTPIAHHAPHSKLEIKIYILIVKMSYSLLPND
jgi:hypothetical protein